MYRFHVQVQQLLLLLEQPPHGLINLGQLLLLRFVRSSQRMDVVAGGVAINYLLKLIVLDLALTAIISTGLAAVAGCRSGTGDFFVGCADDLAGNLFVGGNMKPAATRPAAKVQFAVDVETLRTRTQANEQDQRVPIKMVSGRAWSPGIYWALRLLEKTLDVAWERAFICSLTSN